MLFPLLLANKGDLLYFTKNSHFCNSLLKQEDVFGFFALNALPSCPLLASIFLNREIISFSKPTVGILTKLLKLISLLKRPSKRMHLPCRATTNIHLGRVQLPKIDNVFAKRAFLHVLRKLQQGAILEKHFKRTISFSQSPTRKPLFQLNLLFPTTTFYHRLV